MNLINVNLFTNAGEEVTTLQLSEMAPMPEVIQWGTRHFIRRSDPKNTETPYYEEGFCYVDVSELYNNKRKKSGKN